MRSYLTTSNDSFMGVFIIWLLYLLMVKITDRKKENLTFILIGFVLALCFAIRMTAIFLLVSLMTAFIYCSKNTLVPLGKRIKLYFLTGVVFFDFTALFHLPSLIENHHLSYENKNPENGLTCVQRNYLGLKKIEQGKEKMNRDAIWKNTKFDVVAQYINENGAHSLPKSFSEVFVKDPLLVLKMAIYNVGTCLLRFMRFWGFLFILPIFGMSHKKVFDSEKLPFIVFVLFTISISTVCFTFAEFRWFSGYEVLVPVSILWVINSSKYLSTIEKKNTIVTLSLSLISLFNIKTLLFSFL